MTDKLCDIADKLCDIVVLDGQYFVLEDRNVQEFISGVDFNKQITSIQVIRSAILIVERKKGESVNDEVLPM
jgi:hypothetical protein